MAERLLICFDFEGAYGMPFHEPYDLAGSTDRILATLAARDARAVFFVVGRMVEEETALVEAIAAAGHEVGLHGYDHDDMSAYDADGLARLEAGMRNVCSILERRTGRRPIGFRAPHLLGPRFYDPDVYAMLRRLGFEWVSNREVRYPLELARPGRLPRCIRSPRRGALPSWSDAKALLLALNAGLVTRGTFGHSAVERARWLLAGMPPLCRDGLWELPLYSALDCDLLGLPAPHENTGTELLGYATASVQAAVNRPGVWSMVTFHDWIVSGGNRLVLLARALEAANDVGATVSTPALNPEWLGAEGAPAVEQVHATDLG